LPTDNRPMGSDFEQIQNAWATLPDAIKAGILAMVRAAQKAD
jgi:hypothetical protein